MSSDVVADPVARPAPNRVVASLAGAVAVSALLLLLPAPYGIALPLVGIGLGIFVAAHLYYRDLFSPIGVFAAAWFVPMGIGQLELSRLQAPFDAFTWVILLGSGLAFIAGSVVVAAIRRGRPEGVFSRAAIAATIDRRRFLALLLLLLLLALLAFGYEASRAGGVPILARSRVVAYTFFALPYVHYLTVSTITVGMLSVAHLRLYGRSGAAVAVAALVVSVGVLLALLARLQVLFILAAAVVVVNYLGRRRVSMPALAGLGVLMLVATDAIAGLRDSHSLASGSYAVQLGELRMPHGTEFLAWPYLYLSLDFEQLRFLVHQHLAPTWGARTFEPLLSFTLTRRLLPIPHTEDLLGWFNTMTYLWPIYSDFGLAGVIAVPFGLGAGTTYIYHRLRESPSLERVLAHALVLSCVGSVFFYNFFSFPLTWVLAAEIWLIVRLSRRPAPAA